MNHLAVLPVVLPALTAALLLLVGGRLAVARLLSIASLIALVLITGSLVWTASTGAYQVYALSEWQAPFGILLMVDRLSAMLVLLTALVALGALAYAIQGWDSRGRFFHPIFHFQLMGINGAFLTGDLFNLFVFFEVLLIASYCLLLHGLGKKRLKSAVHYVVINLTGSAVFLIAVSLLYSVTGTLNMAHLAERVAQAQPGDVALIRAAGLMLLGVFGVKAALFPLYFWLPSAYSSASAPVAALFAIMTKVGVYSIVRFSSLIFGAQALGGEILSPWLLPVALVTLGLAAFGALNAKRLSELVAYLTVASVGTMLTAYAAGGQAGLSAMLFYMVHSTFAVAAMFLLSELIAVARGDVGDGLRAGPRLAQTTALGVALLLAGAIIAGLPLSGGFLGKLMILQSLSDSPFAAWAWAVILAASLMTLIGLARAGSVMVWSSTASSSESARRVSSKSLLPFGGFVGFSLLLVIFASPIKGYMNATAAQLVSPAAYIQAAIGNTMDRAPRRMQRGSAR
jgi:multicomponent K+:H+ antiporter subunit D